MNMPSAASEAWETGNTADNGAAPDPSSCDTGTSPAEWYRYIPQCGLAVPEVMITTCDDFTDFDTVISVWKQGPAGECPGTLVACNDDFIDPECQIGPVYRKSRVNFWALNGEVFYIRVSGYQAPPATSPCTSWRRATDRARGGGFREPGLVRGPPRAKAAAAVPERHAAAAGPSAASSGVSAPRCRQGRFGHPPAGAAHGAGGTEQPP